MRSESRRRLAGALSTVARVGQAQAFFGNVYEAVVKVPDVFARNRELAGKSPFSVGSPTLYFVPAGPVTLAASVGALVTGRRNRRWLAASTAATAAAGALTGYVVTRVNKPLLFSPDAADRGDELLRRWHRLNAVRIALVGAAWYASERARQV